MSTEYYLRESHDKTLKQFFERFYVLPKEGKEWGEAEKVN